MREGWHVYWIGQVRKMSNFKHTYPEYRRQIYGKQPVHSKICIVEVQLIRKHHNLQNLKSPI